MKRLFNQHPHSIGETYVEHMRHAFLFGINMLLGGLACLIHGIFPFLFQKTASNILLKMTDRFVARSSVMEERLLNISASIEKKKRNALSREEVL